MAAIASQPGTIAGASSSPRLATYDGLRQSASFETGHIPLAPPCSPPVDFSPSGSSLRVVAQQHCHALQPSCLPMRQHFQIPPSENSGDSGSNLEAQDNPVSPRRDVRQHRCRHMFSRCCACLYRVFCCRRIVTRITCIQEFENEIKQDKTEQTLDDKLEEADPETGGRCAGSSAKAFQQHTPGQPCVSPKMDGAEKLVDVTANEKAICDDPGTDIASSSLSQASGSSSLVHSQPMTVISPHSQLSSTPSLAGTAPASSNSSFSMQEALKSADTHGVHSDLHEDGTIESPSGQEGVLHSTNAADDNEPPAAASQPQQSQPAVGVSELEHTVDMIMWRLREMTPPEQRQRVFIEQCRAWHPDKNSGDQHRATVAFQRLQSTRTWFLAKDTQSRSDIAGCSS